eukprot:4522271-Alexandrium_andersonii.AAC.1
MRLHEQLLLMRRHPLELGSYTPRQWGKGRSKGSWIGLLSGWKQTRPWDTTDSASPHLARGRPQPHGG